MTDPTPSPSANPNPTAPSYAVPAAPANPGKTLGVVALVLAILLPLIGLILGFVANGQSKKAGQKNGLAVAAIVIGAILTLLTVVLFAVGGTLFASLFGGLADVCGTYGSGVWEIDGVTYTCP